MNEQSGQGGQTGARRFENRRVLALGTFDSFLRTAAVIGRMFEAEGASLRIAALAASGTTGQLSTRQLRASGVYESVPMVPAETLVSSRLFREAHVVIAVIDGGRARELFLALSAADFSKEPHRPMIVVASPGVALTEQITGFMSRAPADLLCFNTESERALYACAAAELGVDASNGVTTGLLGLDREKRGPRPDGRPAVVFFEQPVIPERRMHRTHLLAGLVDLARGRPDVDVLIKLRHTRAETAHHATKHHLEDLARAVMAGGKRPANLVFTHENAAALLDRAALAVTVSSTVAVEAMARGVPTRIVSDFGISEAFGTSYFVGSRCFSSLADLDPDMGESADPDWVADRSGARINPEALLSRCADFIVEQDRSGRPTSLRPLVPAYGSSGWMAYALGVGGPVAVHAPHLLDRPLRGLGFVGAVASRLRLAGRLPPRR